jgi:hypothetical protein
MNRESAKGLKPVSPPEARWQQPTMIDTGQPAAVPGRTYRPKTLLYSVLAVLWIFPAIGSGFILVPAVRLWREADSFANALATTRLEHWLAIVLLLLHPFFLWRACRLRRTEVPQPIPAEESPEEEESKRL